MCNTVCLHLLHVENTFLLFILKGIRLPFYDMDSIKARTDCKPLGVLQENN